MERMKVTPIKTAPIPPFMGKSRQKKRVEK